MTGSMSILVEGVGRLPWGFTAFACLSAPSASFSTQLIPASLRLRFKHAPSAGPRPTPFTIVGDWWLTYLVGDKNALLLLDSLEAPRGRTGLAA